MLKKWRRDLATALWFAAILLLPPSRVGCEHCRRTQPTMPARCCAR